MNRWVVSSVEVVGDEVHGANGESLGRIEDVLLDVERGRVAYVVLSPVGAIGKLFAVPWEAMSIDVSRGGDGWRLDVDRARFAAAPGFARGEWPNFADPQFAAGVYSYYGIPPCREAPLDPN